MFYIFIAPNLFVAAFSINKKPHSFVIYTDWYNYQSIVSLNNNLSILTCVRYYRNRLCNIQHTILNKYTLNRTTKTIKGYITYLKFDLILVHPAPNVCPILTLRIIYKYSIYLIYNRYNKRSIFLLSIEFIRWYLIH